MNCEDHPLTSFLRDDSKAAQALRVATVSSGKKRRKSKQPSFKVVQFNLHGSAITLSYNERMEELRQRNVKRFENHIVHSSSESLTANTVPLKRTCENGSISYDGKPPQYIVGICMNIEKSYLRLTAAPDPSNVRPPNVLMLSLEHVKAEWMKNEDYSWCCDQLKAIRQDLLVQGIRTNLTAQVYFHHMRIALEYGDLNEYNQCQSSLLQFKMEGMEMDSSLDDEITCYHILYLLHFKDPHKITEIFCGLNLLDVNKPMTSFAFSVWRTVTLGNYKTFFELYSMAPKMAPYLLDYRVNAMRSAGLKCMISAYDTVPLEYIRGILCFATLPDCEKFVLEKGCILNSENVDCRSTRKSQLK